MHLIGEIANFILDENPSRMVISLHHEENGLHLCVIDNHRRDAEELELIKKSINCPKRPELSGYYGSMAGHDIVGHARLNLIGWQVKHGDVSATDNGTKIDLWLGSDGFDHGKFTIPST